MANGQRDGVDGGGGGTAAASKGGEPPATKSTSRREVANSNERRRMLNINTGFEQLKTLIPRCRGEKLSKAALLQYAAEYIEALVMREQLLAQENAALRLNNPNAHQVPVASPVTAHSTPSTSPAQCKQAMRDAGLPTPKRSRSMSAGEVFSPLPSPSPSPSGVLEQHAATVGFRLAQAPPEYQMRFGATHVLLPAGQNGPMSPMSPAAGLHMPPHGMFCMQPMQGMAQVQRPEAASPMAGQLAAEQARQLQGHPRQAVSGSPRLAGGRAAQQPSSPPPSGGASIMAPPVRTPHGRPPPSSPPSAEGEHAAGRSGAAACAVDKTPPRTGTPTTPEDEQTPSKPPQQQQQALAPPTGLARGAGHRDQGANAYRAGRSSATPAPVAGAKRTRSDSTSLQLMFQAIDEVESSSPSSAGAAAVSVPVPRLAPGDASARAGAAVNGKALGPLPGAPASPSKFVKVAEKPPSASISRRLVLSS